MKPKISLIPPWKKPSQWRELHHNLSHIISARAAEMNRACSLADSIREQLLATSPIMERLCAETCLHCPVVCCLTANIWADFKDALFWHLSGQAVPLQQNLSHANQICRYLGSRGCTLPRLSRPFVCIWYLCPTQVSRLQTSPDGGEWAGMCGSLQSIKHGRQMMEIAFVEAVSGNKVFNA